MGLDNNQTTHINLFPTAFTSSDLPLSTGREPFSLSPPYHTIHLLILLVPIDLMLQGTGWVLVFSSQPGANHPGLPVGLFLLPSAMTD